MLCITTTAQPLNGIVAIINCSNPLLSLVTLFMDTSVEYTWAQITMKSVVSELSLGVIDVALSVFALVSMCVSSSGHCIDTILFSHIALGILCLFSRNVKLEGGYWDQRMRWISGRKCWLNTGMLLMSWWLTSSLDSHITNLLLLQTPFITFFKHANQ
jgi:hypothetical protein